MKGFVEWWQNLSWSDAAGVFLAAFILFLLIYFLTEPYDENHH